MRRLGTMAIPLLFTAAFAVEAAHGSQEGSARVAASDPVVGAEREMNPFLQHARLHVEEMPLAEALTKLAAASGVRVAFSSTHVPGDRLVTCDCVEVSVLDAASILLEGIAFDVVVLGDHLVVRERHRSVPEFRPMNANLPLLSPPGRKAEGRSLSALLNPRQGTITGQVTDARSLAPLSAVQVHIPGTDLGTLTASDGTYELTGVPVGTHTVVVERIGYQSATQEVTIEDGISVTVDVQLSEAALALDEVVVTGTPAGDARRRALGNVVGQITASDLEARPQMRLEQSLGSSLAGVSVSMAPATAGAGSPIRIRGSSSLSLSEEPLIYVDGVRMSARREFEGRSSSVSRLQDIDPSTIESIEVIKGPAAATLYGTEAADGVIQIVTSRGAQGAPVFNLGIEGGLNWQWNPAGRIWEDDYYIDENGAVASHNYYILEQDADRFGKPFFTYGPTQRYNLSVSGGTESIQYYASASHADEKGYSRHNWNERTQVRVNLTLLLTETLTANISSSRIAGATQDITPICTYACFNSAEPAVGPNPEPSRGSRSGRPYETLSAETDIIDRSRTQWTAQLTHEPFDWLSHRLQGGVDDSVLERLQFLPKGAMGFYPPFFGPDGRDGSRSITQIATPTRTLDYSATAALPMGERTVSSLSFGLQYNQTQRYVQATSGRDFAVPALRTVGAAADRDASESFVENITVGMYVQNQLAWDDRLFVTGAVRFDDNSAFGSEFDAAIYPKLSGSWVLSETGFWPEARARDLAGITEFRVRGAWGRSGQQPDAFAAQRLYNPITGAGGVPALLPSAIGNPELAPEVGDEIELGFDSALLEGRMNLGFTYYTRTTRDAIVARPVLASQGFPGAQLVNVGQTSAWGTETELQARVLAPGGWLDWDASLAFTTHENRIDRLGQERLIVTSLDGEPSRSQWHVEGFPIAGLHTHRVMQAEFTDGPGSPVTNVLCDGGTGRGGLEQGGDLVPCADAPKVFYGRVDPTWEVGLRNSWRFFNSWDFSVTVDAAGGHYINNDYRAGRNTRSSRPNVVQDDPIWVANREWSRGAPVITKAGFAKLRELSLGYQIPTRFVERLGANAANVRGIMYNVADIWLQQKYTPDGQRVWDPEMQSPNFEYRGTVMGTPPPMASASIRLNVTF